MSKFGERCARVRLLILDVDGVLTDGRLLFDAKGQESKSFHVRDGHGIRLLQDCGIEVALITARHSQSLAHRAHDLGIQRVYQGSVDKIVAYTELLFATKLDEEEIAYMGDDLIDLAILSRVGLAAAPADAHPEVRARVHWVAQRSGGMGAVRELSEEVLRAQGHWDTILARALGRA